MPLSVSLYLYPETDEQTVRALETLARTAAGLALEGVHVSLHTCTFEDEEVG